MPLPDNSLFPSGTLFPADLPIANPTSLVHTRALGAPQLNPILAPAGLARTRALGTVQTIPPTRVTGIAHSRALGTITVSTVGSPSIPGGVGLLTGGPRSIRGVRQRNRRPRD